MKTKAYEVVIEEVYRTTILVEGSSEADAINQVRDAYRNGYIDTERDDKTVNIDTTSMAFEIPNVCPHCGKVHNPEERDFIGTEGRCSNCWHSLIYKDL